MDREIIISVKTVFFILVLALLVYLVFLLGPIILVLTVATIIVLALEGAVQSLTKQKFMNKPLNRSISVTIIYTALIVSILSIVTIVLPLVLTQGKKLIISLLSVTEEIPLLQSVDLNASNAERIFNVSDFLNVSGNVLSTLTSTLGILAMVVSVIVIAIYMSIDWPNIKNRILSLFTGRMKNEAGETIEEIELSVGYWLKGQLTLMFAIGAMSFIGLAILNVDYPLALGVAAGLLEIVPILGPIIALVLAGIVAFSESAIKGVAVIALFTLIQQVENNYMVPKVMNKVSGFSPLVILIALLIGSKLLGVIGALIAVPSMIIGVIIVKRIIRYSQP
jgi:predicted PurR-regulated permease PerM